MTEQDLVDLEAFLDTLTDADVANQLTPVPAVPTLGTNGSATRTLVLMLLTVGLLREAVRRRLGAAFVRADEVPRLPQWPDRRHYERAGEIKVDDTALGSPSEREVARQQRLKREG